MCKLTKRELLLNKFAEDIEKCIRRGTRQGLSDDDMSLELKILSRDLEKIIYRGIEILKAISKPSPIGRILVRSMWKKSV